MTERTGVLGSYYAAEALKPSARKLGERCGSAAVAMLVERFANFAGTPDDDQHSYIWRSAIEEHEQDAHHDGIRMVLVDVLRDVSLGATGVRSEDALKATRTLLQSDYPTHVRVGIYVCSEHYGSIGHVFWDCAKPDWFVDIRLWHELYWFINKNFSRFSAPERAQFLGYVDSIKGDWLDVARQKELDDTQRRDLLHPATGQGDAEVDAKFSELVKRLGPVREHPDFHTYSSGGWVGELSPVTSDALIEMPDEALARLLEDFVPEGRTWDGPTYRGLASTITAAVRASDDGFSTRFYIFSETRRAYQHGLLQGLKQRCVDDKRDINWHGALELVHTIVTAPAFVADLDAKPAEGWEPSVRWVIGDIADLIEAGASSVRKLSAELMIKSLEVLRIVLTSTEASDANESKDAVSHAINSPRGKTLEALINVAFALRRLESTGGLEVGQAWALVGPILDTELGTSESGKNTDFAALAGMYCQKLHALNPGWVEDNFDRLFSTSSDAAWRCAAQGFAYQRYLYDWLYQKLNAGGHLKKMVYAENLPDSVSEKALQFLGLAYLEGFESLDGEGLLAELVTTPKAEQLARLCWFYWTLRGTYERNSPRAKLILDFWMSVAESIRSSSLPSPELQSALNLLSVFIDELPPPVLQVWVEAAPHAQVRHHGYILVEHMARLVARFPEAVYQVFRAALTGFLPDYEAENVVKCVVGLADAGFLEQAEEICNEYAKRESALLKDTYETLRNAQRGS